MGSYVPKLSSRYNFRKGEGGEMSELLEFIFCPIHGLLGVVIRSGGAIVFLFASEKFLTFFVDLCNKVRQGAKTK
jgi:hypothetical protein